MRVITILVAFLIGFGCGAGFGIFGTRLASQVQLPGPEPLALQSQPTQAPPPPLAPGAVQDQTAVCSPPRASAATGGAVWKAQTFRAGQTGRLDRVTLHGRHLGGTTTLHVRLTDGSGNPVANDLAAADLTWDGSAGESIFDLPDGVQLEAGTLYALALSNSATGGGYGWEYSGSTECYPDPAGHPFTSNDGGVSWSRDQVDFLFTTFVAPN